MKVLIRSGRFLKLEIPLDGVRGALWFSCSESLLQPQMDSFLLWGRLSTLVVLEVSPNPGALEAGKQGGDPPQKTQG